MAHNGLKAVAFSPFAFPEKISLVTNVDFIKHLSQNTPKFIGLLLLEGYLKMMYNTMSPVFFARTMAPAMPQTKSPALSQAKALSPLTFSGSEPLKGAYSVVNYQSDQMVDHAHDAVVVSHTLGEVLSEEATSIDEKLVNHPIQKALSNNPFWGTQGAIIEVPPNTNDSSTASVKQVYVVGLGSMKSLDNGQKIESLYKTTKAFIQNCLDKRPAQTQIAAYPQGCGEGNLSVTESIHAMVFAAESVLKQDKYQYYSQRFRLTFYTPERKEYDEAKAALEVLQK